MPPSLSIVTWNTEWAAPRSKRTPELLRRIDERAPDVVCLTEAHEGLLAATGHTIAAQSDYGYAAPQSRRRALLWSREPWERVDDVGADALPPGRFITGVTQTPIGEVAVAGVCIPWHGSRTEAYCGEARKARWEDHEAYLRVLRDILRALPSRRLIVMGDFNQIIGPGSQAPRRLQAALCDAFPPNMAIVTAGAAFRGRKAIDHVAISQDLQAESVAAISNRDEKQTLSDHFGVAARVSLRSP